MRIIIVIIALTGFFQNEACCQTVKHQRQRDSMLKTERTFKLNDTNKLMLYFTNGAIELTPSSCRKVKYFIKNLDTTTLRKIVVEGWFAGSMAELQQSWEQVNAVMDYLLEHEGLKESQCIFHYDGKDKRNTVTIRYAAPGEDGCARCIVPPHPNMTYHGMKR